jgi:lysozyme family protein
MKMKTKTFDCIEMKNRIQSERMTEFEADKNKYDSYADFIKARSEKSEWVQNMRKKIKRNGQD